MSANQDNNLDSSALDPLSALEDDMDKSTNLGRALRDIRETKAWSTSFLAEKLAITEAELRDIEQGFLGLSIEKAVRFAQEINASPLSLARMAAHFMVREIGLDRRITIRSEAAHMKENEEILAACDEDSSVPAGPFLEMHLGGPLRLGENLRSIRECEEWTQSKMALELGISEQELADIERGELGVDLKTAKDFGLRLEYGPTAFVTQALQKMLDDVLEGYRVTMRSPSQP